MQPAGYGIDELTLSGTPRRVHSTSRLNIVNFNTRSLSTFKSSTNDSRSCPSAGDHQNDKKRNRDLPFLFLPDDEEACSAALAAAA